MYRSQGGKSTDRVFLGFSTQGYFGTHDGKTDEDDGQIDENEGSTAILPAAYGNRQMLPKPIAEPAAARMKPSLSPIARGLLVALAVLILMSVLSMFEPPLLIQNLRLLCSRQFVIAEYTCPQL